MKSAIIVHGCCDKEEYFSLKYPSLSNSHWIPWLQKQLLIKGVFTQTPEFPKPFSPEYKKWKKELERFDINSETVLIGHSCGAGFLLRWLSETKTQVDQLILVAPWMDPTKKRKGFLDFELDPKLEKRVNQIHILFSLDEKVEGVKESVEEIRQFYPGAKYHEFKKMGHFCFEEMGHVEFPELLELVEKIFKKIRMRGLS